MAGKINRQWILAERPPAEPQVSNFKLVEQPIPQPGDGEILIRAVYLSLDPYMRGRMRAGKSYVPPVELGAVMEGGVVGQVIESRNPAFKPGDYVESRIGWQEYAVSDGKGVRVIDPKLAPISTALGVLGMPGMTAYFGTFDVAQPKAGETFVVTAASGAVGALVVQIGKIIGCRVVGIAGGKAKCDYVQNELGADAVIDYRGTTDLRGDLKAACPNGVDAFFDNVGGAIFDAVLGRINLRARIAICGMIAEYNLERPELAPRVTPHLLVNRARIEGFIVFDFAKRYPEGMRQMGEWIAQGKLKYKEDIVDGFEQAPKTLLRLFKGENFGKQLLRIAPEKV